jgi:manganese transport protein
VNPPPASAEAVLPSQLQRVMARGRFSGRLMLLGPAFVAAVAYVDPGNFATNISGGAKYG